MGFRGRRPEARCVDKTPVKSSVKPLNADTEKLIDHTIALWRPRLRRDLTRDDARELTENVAGFFRILAKWSLAESRSPANDPVETGSAGEVRGDC